MQRKKKWKGVEEKGKRKQMVLGRLNTSAWGVRRSVGTIQGACLFSPFSAHYPRLGSRAPPIPTGRSYWTRFASGTKQRVAPRPLANTACSYWAWPILFFIFFVRFGCFDSLCFVILSASVRFPPSIVLQRNSCGWNTSDFSFGF
jgi:hypothetical protein